jgi:uncharacterized protein (TIGR03067 family)
MRTLVYGILASVGLMAAGSSGAEEPKDKAVQEELAKFEGTWKIVSLTVDGTEMPATLFKETRLILRGDKFTHVEGKTAHAGTFKVDLGKKPKQIDITFTEGPEKGKTIAGIYELEGDTYKVCIGMKGTDRPTAFESKAGSGVGLEVLHREKPATPVPTKKQDK